MRVPDRVVEATERVLADVSAERGRQDEKWGGFERSVYPVSLWAAILGEEYGEVCEAMLEGDVENLREECIQVAAVAVSIVEQIDRGEWA